MWEASLGAMLAAGEGEGRGMTESVMGGKLTESGEGGRAGLSGLAQPLLVSSPPRQEAAVRAWPRAADHPALHRFKTVQPALMRLFSLGEGRDISPATARQVQLEDRTERGQAGARVVYSWQYIRPCYTLDSF